MKRCFVCKYYAGIYMCGLIAMFVMLRIGMAFHADGIDTTFEFVFSLVGMGLFLYLLFDYPACIFTVGKEGVSMWLLFWKWHFSWDEIAECALINASTAGKATMNLVYFATRQLSALEKEKFLVETRKDRKHIAFFVCDEKFLREAIPLMPETYAFYLKERARQIGMTIG